MGSLVSAKQFGEHPARISAEQVQRDMTGLPPRDLKSKSHAEDGPEAH